jgi:hypothetical protein
MDHGWTMKTNVVRLRRNETVNNLLIHLALSHTQLGRSRSHTAFTRQRPAVRGFGNIVPGVFTPVLVKHS